MEWRRHKSLLNCLHCGLKLWCLLLFVTMQAAAIAAAPEDSAGSAAVQKMLGRWEGVIEGTFRSQAVSWHFELDGNGLLKGWMGPASEGMPNVPLTGLELHDGRIRFGIPDQHAVYEGRLEGDEEVLGSWKQGTAFPLRMKRKIFAFALERQVRDALAGDWSTELRGNTTRVHFDILPDGSLSGTLVAPGADNRELPLVDLFIEADGYAKFATDEGRSFTGRFVNGVLIGDYRVGRRSYALAFQRPEQQDRIFALALPADQWSRVEGVWERKGGGRIDFHFIRLPGGEQSGQLFVGRRDADPVLSLELNGEAISLLTLSGRSFSGTLQGDTMSGQYRAGSRPSKISFVREATAESAEEVDEEKEG